MKKTKIVAIVLGLATTITMWNPNNVVNAETKSVPAGYTPIYTVEDLYGINDDLNGNYILMNDIDLSETKPGGEWDSGSGWTPIGTNGSDKEYFNGIFDGNGYRIENMTIYGDDVPSVVGLFGAVNGTIKNLALTDIDISCGKRPADCGAIAAWADTVDSCYVTGRIEGTSLALVGGIAGDVRGKNPSITNCYTDVSIIVPNRKSTMAAGIVGSMYSGTLKNCYTIGNVEVYDGQVSGDDHNMAAITAMGDDCSGYSQKCYFLSGYDLSAKRLSKAQMKSQKCFTGFDFKNTWVVDKNSPYPYPQLRNCMQVRTESIELLSAPDKLDYTTADEKLDLEGSELKINYEDDYNVTVPLDESMLSYKLKEGNQIVTVKYNNCKTSFDINVKEAKESLKVTAKKAKLKVGGAYTYKVKYVGKGKVQFNSSNLRVLSIDKKTGKAKAKKAGNVVITVKAGKLSKTIKVKVVK